MSKAVIFDFDGVVIESETYFLDAEVKILNKMEIPLTKTIAAEYLGLKMDDYISALEKRFEKKVDHNALSEALHAEVKRLYEKEIPLVEGMALVLPAVCGQFEVALATSREKQLADMIMCRLRISQYFKKGVYREDVKKGKPDPEAYVKAAALLKKDPRDCVAVEDAENGFRSAKAAGMCLVARKADHNRNQDFSLADIVVEDMKDLPKILSSL